MPPASTSKGIKLPDCIVKVLVALLVAAVTSLVAMVIDMKIEQARHDLQIKYLITGDIPTD